MREKHIVWHIQTYLHIKHTCGIFQSKRTKKTAGSFRKFNYKFQKQMFNKEIYDYDLTFLLSIANRHICMQYQSFNMSLLQYTS